MDMIMRNSMLLMVEKGIRNMPWHYIPSVCEN